MIWHSGHTSARQGSLPSSGSPPPGSATDDVVESVCLAEMQDVHDCGDATVFQGL